MGRRTTGSDLAADSGDHALVDQAEIPKGEIRAIQLAERLGLSVPEPGTATIRRCDLAVDLLPHDPALGQTFMEALALLECPRYKRKVISAAGSNDVESIYWSKPVTLKPVVRIYDKGVESGSHERGARIRMERQWEPPAKDQLTAAVLAAR